MPSRRKKSKSTKKTCSRQIHQLGQEFQIYDVDCFLEDARETLLKIDGGGYFTIVYRFDWPRKKQPDMLFSAAQTANPFPTNRLKQRWLNMKDYDWIEFNVHFQNEMFARDDMFASEIYVQVLSRKTGKMVAILDLSLQTLANILNALKPITVGLMGMGPWSAYGSYGCLKSGCADSASLSSVKKSSWKTRKCDAANSARGRVRRTLYQDAEWDQ